MNLWAIHHTFLFRQECEVRGASIIYATHIFDGLEGWLTHLAFVSRGKLLKGMLWIALTCKPNSSGFALQWQCWGTIQILVLMQICGMISNTFVA